jgi:hypothetical protein
MPLIKTSPFNSPWNPFFPPARKQGGAPQPLIGPSDVSSSGYGGGTGATALEQAEAQAAAASVALAGAFPSATGAGSLAPSPASSGVLALPPPGLVSANVTLPAALRRSGGFNTPSLDRAATEYTYGWNDASQAMYIRFLAARRIVARMRTRRLPDPARMPASGIRLNLGGEPGNGTLLITPDLVSGTYPVLTYRVPAGYYGFLTYATNEYTGAGFAEAAGALIWSIGVNQWFYPGYGQIPYTLGSRLTGLWNFAGGIPIESNQYITYSVAYNNALTLGTGGYVICTLQGWIAPIREKTRETQEVNHGAK